MVELDGPEIQNAYAIPPLNMDRDGQHRPISQMTFEPTARSRLPNSCIRPQVRNPLQGSIQCNIRRAGRYRLLYVPPTVATLAIVWLRSLVYFSATSFFIARIVPICEVFQQDPKIS